MVTKRREIFFEKPFVTEAVEVRKAFELKYGLVLDHTFEKEYTVGFEDGAVPIRIRSQISF